MFDDHRKRRLTGDQGFCAIANATIDGQRRDDRGKRNLFGKEHIGSSLWTRRYARAMCTQNNATTGSYLILSRVHYWPFNVDAE